MYWGILGLVIGAIFGYGVAGLLNKTDDWDDEDWEDEDDDRQ